MSLFDKTNQRRTATREAAAFRPATIGESMQSAWNEVADTATSVAYSQMEYDMFEKYRRKVEELTGDRFFNPLNMEASRLPGATPDMYGGGPSLREALVDHFFNELNGLRTKYPNLPEVDYDSLLGEVTAERARIRAEREDVISRETSFGNDVAGFIGGSGAAILTDPLVLGSMALGAPAATGVIRAALIEAAIGSGSEVAVQASVQSTRERLGEGADFEQAAYNILLAGAGGGLLAGMIRGGTKGVGALLKRARELPEKYRTPEVKAAERYLHRKAEMENHNPFVSGVAGQVEHARRLDAAMFNTVRPLREALKDSTGGLNQLPLDTLPDVPLKRPQEPLEAYTDRVRSENAELFREVDQTNQRISEVDTRINEIDEELVNLPRGAAPEADRLAQLRDQVTELEGQRQSKTVQRKLARAERTIAKLEADPKVAEQATGKRLRDERAALSAEAKELQAKSKQHRKLVKRAVKKTPRRNELVTNHIHKAIDEPTIGNLDREFTKFMADMGAAVGNRADLDLPLSNPVRHFYPKHDPLEIDPELEKTVKDEARIDAALRRAIEEDPDQIIPIEDPETGVITETKLSTLVEELDEERKLYDEFADCIEKALS